MLISLHNNATATLGIRLALQQATALCDHELAEQYGIGLGAVPKWRHRTGVQEESHTAHRWRTALNGT